MSLRWLSRSDVEALALAPRRCLELAEEAARWLSSGEIEVPPKFGVHPPHGRHVHAMPAYVKPLELIGIKWLADYPQNPARGLPTINALIVLNDARTGVPFAIMDGSWITGLRTAAMTAVSLRACAGDDVRTVALVGTGFQARMHLAMIPLAFPRLETIRVAGRTAESAARFVANLEERPANVQLVAADDRAAALRDAPVVVTVTNAVTAPLLEPRWLAPGATVAVVDNAGKETALLPVVDRTVVDDRKVFATAEIRVRFRDGVPRIDAEIGEVLLGRARGRCSPDEIILICNLGTAALDAVFAAEVHRAAIEAGVGAPLRM